MDKDVDIDLDTDDAPVLLLHGLGATSAVWHGFTSQLGNRPWLAPNLAGHGDAARLPRYSFGGLAAAVANGLPRDTGPLVVVGHSMGGVVGIALASGWFGVSIKRVVAVGVKVSWNADDLARAAAFAARPPRVFEFREQAEQAFLKTAGLLGLTEADPAGTAKTEAGWRLALDPATFKVGAPDMAGLLGAARCPVVLASGEHDPMSPPDDLRALREDARTLPGLGHNAHVEDPTAILDLLR